MATDSEHAQAVRDAIGSVLDAVTAAITGGLHVQISLNISDKTNGPVDVDKVGLVRVFRSLYSSERDGPVRPQKPVPPDTPGPP